MNFLEFKTNESYLIQKTTKEYKFKNLPAWSRWIAKDNNGDIYCYEYKPRLFDESKEFWWEEGKAECLEQCPKNYTMNCRDSLIKIEN